MSHQSFELWLFDDEELDPVQKKQLNEHLNDCPQCRQMKSNWEDVRNTMSKLPIAAPSEGFSHRWRLSVEARRELKERSQLWRFFLLLSGAVFTTMIVLAIQVFNAGSPMNWFAFALQNGVNILANVVSAAIILMSWVNVVPKTVSILLWVIVTGLFLSICLCMGLAMKRLASKRTYME